MGIFEININKMFDECPILKNKSVLDSHTDILSVAVAIYLGQCMYDVLKKEYPIYSELGVNNLEEYLEQAVKGENEKVLEHYNKTRRAVKGYDKKMKNIDTDTYGFDTSGYDGWMNE